MHPIVVRVGMYPDTWALGWVASHKTGGHSPPGAGKPLSMISAYAMVFLPQKPSTENWIILPSIVFSAW